MVFKEIIEETLAVILEAVQVGTHSAVAVTQRDQVLETQTIKEVDHKEEALVKIAGQLKVDHKEADHQTAEAAFGKVLKH